MEGYTYYMLESQECIDLAGKYIALYQPMTASELFFEDGEEVVQNQENGNKSVGFLKKAINAVKEMIKRIVDSVTTFFQTMFMGKDEKDKFKKFKEAVKNDPEFAGKKVTVKDFRDISKRYQEALNVIDNGIAATQKAKADKAAQIAEQVTNKAQAILKGVGDTTKAVFSVDTALRLAEGNRSIAKWINSKLNEESYAMRYIESQLGNERARDFKKRVESSTKLLSLHRMKVMVLGQYHKSMSGSLNQVITDFEELLTTKTDAMSNAKRATHMRMVDDALGGLNTKAGTDIKKRDIVKTGVAINREVHDAKKAFNNAAREKKKNIDRMRKEAEREAKRAEQGKPRKEKERRSVMKFIGS